MILQTNNLSKTYTKSKQKINAINNINLSIDEGDFVVIHGSSGCGKSTLLLLLGGMLHPTAGQVLFQNQDLYASPSFLRGTYRKRIVGFMFQKFFLMPYLSVKDNIQLSLSIRKIKQDSAERVQSLTDRLGITQRMNHLPEELSVGEQQRVALARTLAGNPDIILADEPTGNLDKNNKQIIAQCLKEENAQGKTIVLVTHDESLIELGNKQIQLSAGQLTD
jgi:putative ABC transport system ATP-binding protein